MSWKIFKTEEELAKVVVSWLEKEQWRVFQEVQTRMYGPIADIVAVKDRSANPKGPKTPLIWIVECKLTQTINLLDQAMNWIGIANFVSVAIPYPYHGRNTHLWERIYKPFGVGILHVQGVSLLENLEARFYRRGGNQRVGLVNLLDILTEEHRSFGVAGSKSGQRYTAFKATRQNLIRLAGESPGLTMKQAVKRINHHYSREMDAIGALSNLIRSGVIKELEFRKTNRRNHLYMKEER